MSKPSLAVLAAAALAVAATHASASPSVPDDGSLVNFARPADVLTDFHGGLQGFMGDRNVKKNGFASEMKTKLAEYIKDGKTPYFTIISKLADPDALNAQAERIKFTGVTFDEVTLVDFENGKLGEESYPFEYEDFEFLDTIDV